MTGLCHQLGALSGYLSKSDSHGHGWNMTHWVQCLTTKAFMKRILVIILSQVQNHKPFAVLYADALLSDVVEDIAFYLTVYLCPRLLYDILRSIGISFPLCFWSLWTINYIPWACSEPSQPIEGKKLWEKI